MYSISLDADVVVSDPFLFVCKQKVLDFDKDYKVINWKKTKLIYFENELDLSDLFWVFILRFLRPWRNLGIYYKLK